MRSSSTCRSGFSLRPRLFAWFLAGLVVFTADVALAIDPTRAMSQYIRDRWGFEQGFPKGPVYAISQTRDGYLWIGTEAGLVRFDGLNFRIVQDPLASFAIKRVLGLTSDKDGNLWVRLQGPTILRYRDGVFHAPASQVGSGDSNITAMCRSNQGEVLVSRMEEGAFVFRGDQFQLLATAAVLGRSPVLSLAQTMSGDVWMGTRDAGLFRVRSGQTLSVTDGLPDLKINCILPDGDKDLWIGTDSGIAHWDGTKITSAAVRQPLNSQILAIVKDRDANIWVGTNTRGLLRLNAGGVSAFAGDERDAITALFEDQEGNLWAGGASGLQRFRDSIFVTYSTSEGLPSDSNGPVYADSEGRTWFAPADGGLFWLREGQHVPVMEAEFGNDIVYSIAGRKDEVWIGRQRGGLTLLRSDGVSFKAKTYTEKDGLAQNSVYVVHQNRDGTVWAGTLSAGVSKLSGGKFTTYTTSEGLASNAVTSIMEDPDGTMWFGTPGGLNAFSNDRWRLYTVRNGLPSDSINSLFQDSTGVLWIGTASGLAFVQNGNAAMPSNLPPILKEQVLGLAEDKKGWLWIATSNHVLRVNRDKLMRGAIAEADLREFGQADGLHGVEGVKRDRSVVADSRGRIWFSMNRGLSVVDPERLGVSFPTIAHVQTVSVDGAEFELKNYFRIPPHPQRIAFHYAGLGLSTPERVRFRYMLEGFDRGWTEPSLAREAVYTNLGPGPYRFRVIASNPDGLWSAAEDAINVDIDPAYWQAWWFRVSAVLLGVFVTVAIYRLRLRHLAEQMNLRFEERLSERTRVAQDLHDTLLQGCLSASMQLHVAVDRMPADSAIKEPLTHVQQLMGRVIDEGRNAVRGLRSSDDAARDLEQAFSRVPAEVTMEEDVGFRIIVEGMRRPLHPLIRDEVYRIGREAIMNAFRHAAAQHIEVEIEYSRRGLCVLVRDDGRGMDSTILSSRREGHLGLSGMRERAERIGGRVHILSRPTAGTEVELSVPGKIAFQIQRRPGSEAKP